MSLLALAALAAGALGACANPPAGGEATASEDTTAVSTTAAALEMCGAGGASCTSADQCCSNRCDITDPQAGTGVCRATTVLEGPLVELPASVKASDLRVSPP